MVNRIKTAAFSLVALTLAGPLAAEDGADASTVVATINGTNITVGHMILMHDDLPDQFKQYPADVLFDAIYIQLVEQVLLAGSVPEPAPSRVIYSVENEERNLLSSLAIQQVFDEAATEDAVLKAYQEEWLDADLGSEFNASHILVATEEEATALLAELKDGLDFAEAAMTHSTGPSGPNGGSLNWFQRGDMVGPFDEAIAAMAVGELAGPVQTQFGWHLIKLNDTRVIEPLDLDVVRGELVDQLGSEALDVFIADLKSSASIERKIPEDFDPSILKDQSILEN